MRNPRDPYASQPVPKERGGPLLRFAIVAALLGAAVWGYMTFSEGPTLTEADPQEQTIADSGAPPAYPVATQTSPSETAPAQRTAPAPAPAESVPAPSTTTVPPG